MRYVTSGESHGRALTATVTHVPAGVVLSQELIDADLARRQIGYGRGGRMKIERDTGAVLSGVRFGRTMGTPITITVMNRDWDNWIDVMSTWGAPTDSARVTAPRPGHADLPGVQKIGSDDVRDILERASARETAARVAAGAVAKAFLAALGVSVASYVQSIGDAALPSDFDSESVDYQHVEDSDVRCPDQDTATRMRTAIDRARDAGESLGGVFCVTVSGVVPGVGSYAEADRRLDAALAQRVMSIPAIKGVEIGDGFRGATLPGSRVHDPILHSAERGIYRDTNRAGGLEGGMTNGEMILVRGAMKPIPTLMTPLASIDLDSHAPVDASRERSDVCAVPAAAVVAEAEVAFALACGYMDKFGSDCMEDILGALEAYRQRTKS